MSGYCAENYECPCCSFPYLSPGRFYSDLFGRTQPIEINDTCRHCDSEFTTLWSVKKNKYLPPIYIIHKNNYHLNTQSQVTC